MPSVRLLDGEVEPSRELRRAQEVKWPLALQAGYAVSLLALSVHTYERSEDPFIWNAREEGMPAA